MAASIGFLGFCLDLGALGVLGEHGWFMMSCVTFEEMKERVGLEKEER